MSYKTRAPPRTPSTPAAAAGIAKPVILGARPSDEAEESDPEPEPPPFVTAATLTPYSVLVLVTVVPFPVIVVVTTLDPVVVAVHPSQLVQGASVLHGPSVQPDQVLPGQAEPPHHEVQGPFVQAPDDLPAHGPQPCCGPSWPKGPQPFWPFQPPTPPGPQGPPVGQAELVVQPDGQFEPPVRGMLAYRSGV